MFECYVDGLGRELTEHEVGAKKASPEESEKVVRFRSNGVCKPCRFLVKTSNGHALHVTLGMTGRGKVELKVEN